MTSPLALIVEDDPSLRYLVRLVLEQAGWQVIEAATGDEGIAAVDHGAVTDAVLLDMELPGPDGIAVLTHLRAQPRWQDVPVMMLTSHGDEPTVERALAAGASDYLSKPFDAVELITRLEGIRRSGLQGWAGRGATVEKSMRFAI